MSTDSVGLEIRARNLVGSWQECIELLTSFDMLNEAYGEVINDRAAGWAKAQELADELAATRAELAHLRGLAPAIAHLDTLDITAMGRADMIGKLERGELAFPTGTTTGGAR